jgi:hypothetical protein
VSSRIDLAEETNTMPFECPRGDNGICGDPEPGSVAALVWDGEVSVLSGRLLDEVLGSADSQAAVTIEEREFNALVETVWPLRDPRHDYPPTNRLHWDEAPMGRWVYVECKPCGDYVRVPVP